MKKVLLSAVPCFAIGWFLGEAISTRSLLNYYQNRLQICMTNLSKTRLLTLQKELNSVNNQIKQLENINEIDFNNNK